jgi:endogenous inhibitor of DNA gyrase (YacG/DUF329 family)
MNDKSRNEHETPCPRCGAEAAWSYLDSAKTRIEVMCPECGTYEISREQFDEAEAEIAELNELDQR